MKPMSNFISLLSLTLCLSLLPHVILGHQNITSTNTSTSNQIAKACEFSFHKDLCIATLKSDPSSYQADIPNLLLIALKLASSNATNTIKHIGVLLHDQNLDPAIEQGLTDCSEKYLDAVDQIENSMASVTAKAYHDIYTWLKAAVADADSCQAAFQGDAAHSLTDRNRRFRQLCNNVLSITKHLA